MSDKFTDEFIATERKLANRATPRPWEVHNTDDEYFMNVFYITKQNGPDVDFESEIPESEFPHSDILAITMIQTPRYADNIDAEDNAIFICHATNNYLDALDEITRLRKQFEVAKAWIPSWVFEDEETDWGL
jgi:hypothetical protein